MNSGELKFCGHPPTHARTHASETLTDLESVFWKPKQTQNRKNKIFEATSFEQNFWH